MCLRFLCLCCSSSCLRLMQERWVSWYPSAQIVAIAASRFMYKKGWLGEITPVPAVTGDDDPETVIEVTAEESSNEQNSAEISGELKDDLKESGSDSLDSSDSNGAADSEKLDGNDGASDSEKPEDKDRKENKEN